MGPKLCHVTLFGSNYMYFTVPWLSTQSHSPFLQHCSNTVAAFSLTWYPRLSFLVYLPVRLEIPEQQLPSFPVTWIRSRGVDVEHLPQWSMIIHLKNSGPVMIMGIQIQWAPRLFQHSLATWPLPYSENISHPPMQRLLNNNNISLTKSVPSTPLFWF